MSEIDRVTLIRESGHFGFGPCFTCTPELNQAHRMIDVIQGRHEYGETIPDLAEDYEIPEPVIDAIVNLTDDEYRELCGEVE